MTIKPLFLTTSLFLAGGCAVAQQPAPPSVTGFDRSFLFAYVDWNKNNAKVENGKLVLKTPNGRGGLGDNVELDLTGFGDFSPVVRATIGPENKAKRLRVSLNDESGKSATFNFSLVGKSGDVLLTPEDGASIAAPNAIDEKKGAPDLSKIRQWQVQGDWGNEKFDVALDEIQIVAPNAQIGADRLAYAERLAKEREAARVALENARKNIRHGANQPQLLRVYAAAPNLIGLEIQEGKRQSFDRVPYVPQEGDKIEGEKGDALLWDNGKLVTARGDRQLKRGGKNLGYIVGGRDHSKPHGQLYLQPAEQKIGEKLELLTVDASDSYTINGAAPAKVFRKSKPNDWLKPNGEQLIRHTVYLQTSAPLEAGKTYELAFPGVNLDQAKISFKHDPKTVRSEAIHTSHIGYRPDDPFKRAFLSLWLGNGGAHSFDGATKFEILDDKTGKTVYTGDIKKLMAADGKEKMREQKNYSLTAVYGLDFSDFKTPGTFKIHVPNVGVSYPVYIGSDAWTRAFQTSMRGFLNQRSGIELKKPWADLERPRPMHPADGFVVFQSKESVTSADLGPGDWFARFTAGRTEETLPQAWGGYHDAGDYDRHFLHLWATYQVLELADLFPAQIKTKKLSLPPNEAGDNIPDALNEALWNLDLFRRLQKTDGSVRGGIESSAHPRMGETSWLDSLALMAYESEPGSSYTFAAVAARASRVLAPYNAQLAQTYATAARRAFENAEKTREPFIETWSAQFPGEKESIARNSNQYRAAAAVEIYQLTGDAKAHEVFKSASGITGNPDEGVENQHALFAYAKLPANLGDAALKAKAKAKILELADRALQFADGNVFGLTTEFEGLPEMGPVGYFTTPGMISNVVPRAHFLSGEQKYLAGTIRATNFAAGANPDNHAMTTGVGWGAPKHPLHLESRFSNQPAPPGLTLYGSTDPARTDGFNEWVHIWVLGNTMQPNSRTWPATEFYVDMFMWPMMNEFTIRQNIGPTNYYWGYLASRQ